MSETVDRKKFILDKLVEQGMSWIKPYNPNANEFTLSIKPEDMKRAKCEIEFSNEFSSWNDKDWEKFCKDYDKNRSTYSPVRISIGRIITTYIYTILDFPYIMRDYISRVKTRAEEAKAKKQKALDRITNPPITDLLFEYLKENGIGTISKHSDYKMGRYICVKKVIPGSNMYFFEVKDNGSTKIGFKIAQLQNGPASVIDVDIGDPSNRALDGAIKLIQFFYVNYAGLVKEIGVVTDDN